MRQLAALCLIAVLSSEQRTERTICLSEHVARYVSVRTPWTGNAVDGMYIDLLIIVSTRRSISQRLLSRSLFVLIDCLQPTPLCQMAYVTLFFAFGNLGRVN